MVRDWDFRRRAPRPKVVATTAKKKTSYSQLHYLWLLALVVIGLILITLGLTRAEPVENTTPAAATPATTTNTSSNDSSETTNNVFTSQPSGSSIQIYDGGAGIAKVDQLIDKLKEENLTAISLGRSQFDYAGTTIWYIPGEEELAKKVGAQLPQETIIYKESQLGTAAGFTVLVYLGR